MNRREALAALLAMPNVARIQRADVKPNDVIVIESDRPLSSAHIENILASVKRIWPDRKAVALDDSLRLKIVPE